MPTPDPPAFPAGAYAVQTYLTVADTNCTAQSSTWRCFPYAPYTPASASQALVTFNWLINSTAGTPTTSSSGPSTSTFLPPSASQPAAYTISSSDNPFAIAFANVSLALVDAGRPSERYTFALPLDKFVLPNSPITADNTAAGCWYNQTRFEASLYTRMMPNVTADSPSGASSSAPTPSPTNGWQSWPFAVNVTQSIRGGRNVPNCYELMNGVLGAPVTRGLEPRPADQACACGWRNFGL